MCWAEITKENNSMKRFKEYLQEAEGMSRRGFLAGLASFAASAAVPDPVVKMLSTPAGVATMPIAAGIALLKGIQDHLDQWDPEDDDDYYEAWEDMRDELGFNATDDDGAYHDPLGDLLNLYDKNPKQAAEQLIKHLQSKAIDSSDVTSSFTSRADDPGDWRYQNKLKEPDEIDPNNNSSTDLANVSRLAGLAKGVAGGGDQEPTPAVKDMGPVQYAKDTPALPAPTRPEVDLTPDLKSKEKVPAQRKGGLAESTELTGILKNAGLKG
jgi:hypothetical protein